MLKKRNCLTFLTCLLLLLSCQNKDKNGNPLDTPTSGEITIAADESLRPIVDAEVKAFEAIYKYAEINVVYGSESASMINLLDDTARVAVICRTLLEDELSIFENQKIIPSTIKIGIGALALIVHKDNPDSLFSFEQLKSVFRGEINQWTQINPASPLGDIRIIFDNEDASSVRYLKDSVAKIEKFPNNFFALNANEKVVDYVSQNKNALGVIGVSWISDSDDTTAIGFLDQVKVVALAAENQEFYKPYQAYIAQSLYPLTRNIYIISREARAGLGSGFMSFVAGDKGQRVVLKSGLVPATMPVRILQFSEE